MTSALEYMSGFGNEFQSEAVAGALPQGQNSPQKCAFGLYSELVSGTVFTAPRALNRRSYLFRTRPTVAQPDFQRCELANFKTPPLEFPPYPMAMRWDPYPLELARGDFLDGMTTICGNGSPVQQSGLAIHTYCANRSMTGRAFSNADGEMLILPQHGGIRVTTEVGLLEAAPGELVLIPKGMKFRVDLLSDVARGFVCENFGHPFVLPELGLIGSNGLANACDFLTPVAHFEDSDEPVELVHKYAGAFWSATMGHSPFNVVAWRGNWAACKFDMHRFVVLGAQMVDHPDPSIFCALTSPSHPVAGGNVDFMILPPRWLVAEHTFRPPGFHRSAVAEFLALIQGAHDTRASRFAPGASSLHNNWTAHGPDVATHDKGRVAELVPTKFEETLVIMLDSRFPYEIAPGGMDGPHRQLDCTSSWQGFQKRFPNQD